MHLKIISDSFHVLFMIPHLKWMEKISTHNEIFVFVVEKLKIHRPIEKSES